jgi:hypothetical protein
VQATSGLILGGGFGKIELGYAESGKLLCYTAPSPQYDFSLGLTEDEDSVETQGHNRHGLPPCSISSMVVR